MIALTKLAAVCFDVIAMMIGRERSDLLPSR
jgi:hypothetical protein